MRLLHTKKLEFQEFYDEKIPEYAILSHRWIGNEVTYAEFDSPKARKRPEFSKIKNCCSLADTHGFEWVWIDTCCIDKKSSAELTESINSMYRWYQRAEICYAYLADVRMVEDEHGNWEESRAEFRRSAWFTRGWTLQELLAPRTVLFLDRHWGVVGFTYKPFVSPGDEFPGLSRKTRILNEDISFATGIKVQNIFYPREARVARKFSWLSRRETSRVEDMAYCMLGLCGVNMPLLYGEGDKAFIRLQMEIIKSSDDESIFAWFSEPPFYCSPLLARHPRDFAKSGSLVRPRGLPGKMPFSMTNKGLQYQVPLAEPRQKLDSKYKTYELPLDCSVEDEADQIDYSSLVTITLHRVGGRWWRLGYDKMKLRNESLWTDIVESPNCTYETLYIRAD